MEDNRGPFTLRRGQYLRGKTWKTEALLCFDGGGIRGYASILMLEKLMKKIRDVEIDMGLADVPDDHLKMYPCYYFDYFYGTSTGGLISIMLGRLRMSLQDAKRAYTTMSRDIFDRERYHRGLRGIIPHITASWDPTGLENSIKTIVADSIETPVRDRVGGDVQSPDERLRTIAPKHHELFTHMPSPSDLCRVGVLSYVKEHSLTLLRLMLRMETTVIFRSFEIPDAATGNITNMQQIPFHNVSILWASRATTAAPGYFPPMEIVRQPDNSSTRSTKFEFLDGGAGTNNPTRRAFEEVQKLRSCEAKINEDLPKTGLYVVSIGTGIPLKESPEHKKEKKLGRVVGKMKDMIPEPLRRGITDTEAVHKWMAAGAQGRLDHDHYFRFNVGRGLYELPMDHFDLPNPNARDGPHGRKHMGTQGFMEHHVNEAFKEAGLDAQLDRLARNLAEMRRQRMDSQPLWDRVVKKRRLYEYRCGKVNALLHQQEPAPVLRYNNFDNLFTTTEEALKNNCAACPVRPEDCEDPRMVDEFLVTVGPLQANCAW